MIYRFKDQVTPDLKQVGGKAKALIEMTGAGFPVPEGLVLSVDFLGPWLAEIKNGKTFEKALKETSLENCDAVKSQAESLRFSPEQRRVFNKVMVELPGEVFAVRSSSPEEDLEGTSFAGMYETYLGTLRDTIEIQVARAFASCFDYRVMAYKVQNNIPLENTAIAVIVQKQIASDVSGVGFSLNPLNNCYDEVMINASFGLGEAIVSGLVTPDTYVYDTYLEHIIDKQVNKKEIALYLNKAGGLDEKAPVNMEAQALSNEEIEDLAQLIKKCESHYGKPMDTEWAYEDGHLYLLQSRPITTYIPFFEELLTKPGEKKRFYMDLMVMTQGFSEPMSVLGLELWAGLLDSVKMGFMGSDVKGSAPALHGRHYFSFTDLQKVVGKKTVNRIMGSYDGNVKKIFDEIDLAPHFPVRMPIGSENMKRRMFKMALISLPKGFKAYFSDHNEVVKEYETVAGQVIEKAKAFHKDDDFLENVQKAMTLLMEIMSTISIMYAGMISQASIKKMFKGEDISKEIVALSMDLSGNPTSAMGHLLYKMACYEEFKETDSRENFVTKCQSRQYSDAFMIDYDEFMEKYAVRGMKEIDVASKRVYEDVGLLYDKLVEINTEDNQINSVKEKRQEAYDKLLSAAKFKGKEKKFIKAAAKYQATFGYREHPKYIIVYIFGMFHKMCLEIAEEWVKAGRLEESYQIFDLHVDDIAEAIKNKSVDLMAQRDKNLEGYKKVDHIKDWPLVIDSRGKIYKSKLEIKEGDIMGDPIAPGKVVGKAKVLRSPYEKPLEPGEILVTRGTEPSWTPIFINAAGVIMEIGGPLQHGGIIAREYGIPCVSGLMGIMDMIQDGDLIEVDGYNGVVKLLNEH